MQLWKSYTSTLRSSIATWIRNVTPDKPSRALSWRKDRPSRNFTLRSYKTSLMATLALKTSKTTWTTSLHRNFRSLLLLTTTTLLSLQVNLLDIALQTTNKFRTDLRNEIKPWGRQRTSTKQARGSQTALELLQASRMLYSPQPRGLAVLTWSVITASSWATYCKTV